MQGVRGLKCPPAIAIVMGLFQAYADLGLWDISIFWQSSFG